MAGPAQPADPASQPFWLLTVLLLSGVGLLVPGLRTPPPPQPVAAQSPAPYGG